MSKCKEFENTCDSEYAVSDKQESIKIVESNTPYSKGVRGVVQAFGERQFHVRQNLETENKK